jgi:hypothetical protein
LLVVWAIPDTVRVIKSKRMRIFKHITYIGKQELHVHVVF